MFRKLYPFFLVFVLLNVIGCNIESVTNKADQLLPGAVMSVDNGEGGYGIVKILAADDSLVHIRMYKGYHKERPASVTEKDLQLGSIRDTDGFGIGHLPVSRYEFALWKPALIIQQKVNAEELEGYNIWKEDMGK